MNHNHCCRRSVSSRWEFEKASKECAEKKNVDKAIIECVKWNKRERITMAERWCEERQKKWWQLCQRADDSIADQTRARPLLTEKCENNSITKFAFIFRFCFFFISQFVFSEYLRTILIECNRPSWWEQSSESERRWDIEGEKTFRFYSSRSVDCLLHIVCFIFIRVRSEKSDSRKKKLIELKLHTSETETISILFSIFFNGLKNHVGMSIAMTRK